MWTMKLILVTLCVAVLLSAGHGKKKALRSKAENDRKLTKLDLSDPKDDDYYSRKLRLAISYMDRKGTFPKIPPYSPNDGIIIAESSVIPNPARLPRYLTLYQILYGVPDPESGVPDQSICDIKFSLAGPGEKVDILKLNCTPSIVEG